jgi:hypothetical protein
VSPGFEVVPALLDVDGPAFAPGLDLSGNEEAELKQVTFVGSFAGRPTCFAATSRGVTPGMAEEIPSPQTGGTSTTTIPGAVTPNIAWKEPSPKRQPYSATLIIPPPSRWQPGAAAEGLRHVALGCETGTYRDLGKPQPA